MDAQTLGWAMRKLAAAFPGSFGDEAKVTAVAALWAELLAQHPGIGKAAFVAGVYDIAWKHQSDYLPAPAAALDFFRLAQANIDRETAKALPAPVQETTSWDKKTGPQRAAFLERHLAIGVLKGRGNPEPSEQDIAGVVGQLRAKRFCATTLGRIAAGETVTPADLIASGAPRTAGRPITGPERAAAYQRRGIQWPGAEE